MAKKAQKGKTAKKATKPVKKSAVKKAAAPKKASKPAKKAAKPAKKATVKKAAKPAKKAAPQKKQAKPAKKSVAKKPVKKVTPKKTGKKIASKKPVAKKPVKKVAVKKQVKKVQVKKAATKKVIAKVIKKPVAVAKKAVKNIKKETKNVFIKNAGKVVAGAAAAIAAGAAAASKTVRNAIQEAVHPKAEASKGMEAPRRKSRRRPKQKQGVETIRPRQEVKIDMTKPVIQRMEKPKPKPQINSDTRSKYTDAELQEFKELIIKKLEEAQKDYELLKSTLSHKDDHGTDDTSPTFKLLEDGSDVLSKEETAHLAARQEKFIQNLQNALIRIENKSYGVCRATGKLISKERLRSVPHATLSIDAKLDQNA